MDELDHHYQKIIDLEVEVRKEIRKLKLQQLGLIAGGVLGAAFNITYAHELSWPLLIATTVVGVLMAVNEYYKRKFGQALTNVTGAKRMMIRYENAAMVELYARTDGAGSAIAAARAKTRTPDPRLN